MELIKVNVHDPIVGLEVFSFQHFLSLYVVGARNIMVGGESANRSFNRRIAADVLDNILKRVIGICGDSNQNLVDTKFPVMIEEMWEQFWVLYTNTAAVSFVRIKCSKTSRDQFAPLQR